MDRNHQRRLITYISFALFITALLIRVAYVFTLEIDTPIRADAEKYFSLALNMVTHGEYSLSAKEPFVSTNYITPGYPGFLAVIMWLAQNMDTFYFATLLIQALLGAMTSALVFCIASRLVPPKIASLAGLLTAVSPHLIVFSGYVLTETLFIFSFVVSIWLLILAHEKHSPLWFFVAGLILGFSVLIRPALMLFIVFATGYLLLSDGFKQIKLNLAGLFLGFILILSPWQIWKSQHPNHNEPSLLAAAIALGGYPDLIHKDPELRGFPYREDPEYQAMVSSPLQAVTVILSRAQAEPEKFIRWYVWNKAFVFWQPGIISGFGGPFVYPVNSTLFNKAKAAGFVAQGMFWLHPFIALTAMVCTFLLLVKHIFKTPKSNDFSTSLVAGAVMYFFLIHMLLAAIPRYAIPLYPMIFILFVFGLYQLIQFSQMVSCKLASFIALRPFSQK